MAERFREVPKIGRSAVAVRVLDSRGSQPSRAAGNAPRRPSPRSAGRGLVRWERWPPRSGAAAATQSPGWPPTWQASGDDVNHCVGSATGLRAGSGPKSHRSSTGRSPPVTSDVGRSALADAWAHPISPSIDSRHSASRFSWDRAVWSSTIRARGAHRAHAARDQVRRVDRDRLALHRDPDRAQLDRSLAGEVQGRGELVGSQRSVGDRDEVDVDLGDLPDRVGFVVHGFGYPANQSG